MDRYTVSMTASHGKLNVLFLMNGEKRFRNSYPTEGKSAMDSLLFAQLDWTLDGNYIRDEFSTDLN